jgi:hypothetical protein
MARHLMRSWPGRLVQQCKRDTKAYLARGTNPRCEETPHSRSRRLLKERLEVSRWQMRHTNEGKAILMPQI